MPFNNDSEKNLTNEEREFLAFLAEEEKADKVLLANAEIEFISALEAINSRINDIIDKAKIDERYIPLKEKAVKLHDALLSAGTNFFNKNSINPNEFKKQCHAAIENARVSFDWSDLFSIITSITTSVRRGLVNTASKLGFFATKEEQLDTMTEQQLDTLDNSLQKLVLPLSPWR